MAEIFLRGINLLEKTLRAEIINDYLTSQRTRRCVCFSCGNSARLLRDTGLDVVYIGEKGILKPNKWFSKQEIQSTFNGLFDATSGNLNEHLMEKVAVELKRVLSDSSEIERFCYLFKENHFFDEDTIRRFNPQQGEYLIPTGSGETILCLKYAFPQLTFIPIRIRGNLNTEFHEGYSLNPRLLKHFGSYGKEISLDY
jgi:hypothetical protein